MVVSNAASARRWMTTPDVPNDNASRGLTRARSIRGVQQAPFRGLSPSKSSIQISATGPWPSAEAACNATCGCGDASDFHHHLQDCAVDNISRSPQSSRGRKASRSRLQFESDRGQLGRHHCHHGQSQQLRVFTRWRKTFQRRPCMLQLRQEVPRSSLNPAIY